MQQQAPHTSESLWARLEQITPGLVVISMGMLLWLLLMSVTHLGHYEISALIGVFYIGALGLLRRLGFDRISTNEPSLMRRIVLCSVLLILALSVVMIGTRAASAHDPSEENSASDTVTVPTGNNSVTVSESTRHTTTAIVAASGTALMLSSPSTAPAAGLLPLLQCMRFPTTLKPLPI